MIAFNRLHDIASWKPEHFITTSVTTSNPPETKLILQLKLAEPQYTRFDFMAYTGRIPAQDTQP
jgi:hypothetical protein